MYQGTDYLGDIRQIVGCRRCELSITRKNICIYRGSPMAEVMLMGEAPGPKEDEQGIPMVGPTGSYLIRLMRENGFSLDRIYVTNIVLCLPPGIETSFRAPSGTEVGMCAKWRDLQISLVKPKVILAVGLEAAKTLIPDLEKGAAIHRIEGRIYAPPYLRGTRVIPLRHPSGVRRSGSETSYELAVGGICSEINKLLELEKQMY